MSKFWCVLANYRKPFASMAFFLSTFTFFLGAVTVLFVYFLAGKIHDIKVPFLLSVFNAPCIQTRRVSYIRKWMYRPATPLLLCMSRSGYPLEDQRIFFNIL